MKRALAILLVSLGTCAALISPAAASTYCGGIEGFEIRAETARTTCSFARAAMKKVRYLAFHNEGKGLPPRFKVKVRHRRLSCRNFYVDEAQTVVCKGRQRMVRLQYTFP
jgi:hypothetical protein